MPQIDSNIPNNIFYSAFVGETHRIAGSTLHFSNFLPNIREYHGKVRNYENFIYLIMKHQEDYTKFVNDANYLIKKSSQKRIFPF